MQDTDTRVKIFQRKIVLFQRNIQNFTKILVAVRRNDGKLCNKKVIQKLIDHRNNSKELNNVTGLSNGYTANLA